MKLSQVINKKYVILVLIFGVLVGMETLVMPSIISGVTDAIQRKDLTLLTQTILWGILGFALVQLASFLWNYFKAKLSQSFYQDARAILFRQSFQESHTYESVQNMMFNDLPMLEGNYLLSWVQLIYCLGFSAISAIYIFVISWKVALIFILFSLPPIVLPKLFEKWLQQSSQHYSEENERLVKEFTEDFRGIGVIKSYQQSYYFFNRFVEQVKQAEQASINKKLASMTMSLTLGVVAGSFMLIPFGIGGYLASQGELTSGGLLAVFLAADRVVSPLENAIGYWSNITSSQPILEKINTFIKTTYQLSEAKGENIAIKNIHFDKAAMGYDHALYQVDTSLLGGDSILFIGSSGSGKSTLFKTLFQKQKLIGGNIFINGVSLEEYNVTDLYASIGYIPQDLTLFDDTVRFNLTLGEEFSDQKIREVLEKVGLGQLVADKGLDFIVGTEGSLLSGGQKARLVVARALIRDYQVLLVDEFSASLDRVVAKTIRQLLFDSNLTIIEIAHHYDDEDKAKYDHIWEINDGRLQVL